MDYQIMQIKFLEWKS